MNLPHPLSNVYDLTIRTVRYGTLIVRVHRTPSFDRPGMFEGFRVHRITHQRTGREFTRPILWHAARAGLNRLGIAPTLLPYRSGLLGSLLRPAMEDKDYANQIMYEWARTRFRNFQWTLDGQRASGVPQLTIFLPAHVDRMDSEHRVLHGVIIGCRPRQFSPA